MNPLKGVTRGDLFLPAAGRIPRNGGEDFLETLKSFYHRVDQDIKEANHVTEAFSAGERRDVHEVMIATERADIHFRLLMQIRNKLLEAYQEIARMQF